MQICLHKLIIVGGFFLFSLCAAWAQDEDVDNEYRFTVFPFHKITDDLTGFGYLGYVNNPEEDYETGYLGYGMSYTVNPVVQLWGGLISTYTDNEDSADKLELRPFAGVKLFLPNELRWNIYNYTRYEYRDIQDRDTHDWTETHRIRSRFGVEIPLTSRERAWQTGTWYGLADVEPFYRFDRGEVDPLRFRAGVAYILNDRVRMELIYHAQFTRQNGNGLEFTDNIFRINVKVALERGVLQHLFDRDTPEE